MNDESDGPAACYHGSTRQFFGGRGHARGLLGGTTPGADDAAAA